ncbi:hypothetical protein EZV76_03215 [Flagellimonas alvinocaridis]|uniref:Uncharacterized protein n=1 Tax=Flagellimonas alvinocaridis TaxID=2530200 RepID=A0A4S8RRM6_9FLAO|nr:hypothetical protein [Allomuricauda alvinocaridis]THV61353.1 hypothetical protein EZV76_03215 [Allomuricauda alvinocaridis]
MKFEERYGNFTNKQIKKTLLFAMILIIGFMILVLMEVLGRKDMMLKYDQEVDLLVTKVKRDKGVLTLQDSIAISGATPLISPIKKMKAFANYKDNFPQKYFLDQIVPKYRIIRKANSDTITIYHYGDTLLFKLLSD